MTGTKRAGRAILGAAAVLAALALAGCGQGGVAGSLRSAGIAGKPDEFMVLPTRPLEMPENLTALPPPTPGAVNRVDYRPHAEAVSGLTGRPQVQGSGGGGLVAAAGPRDPAIRGQLAQEDVAWRQTHHGRLLERLFSSDREALVYRPMVLNAPEAFETQRAQGRRVPAAPPAALAQ
ncbi:DUF3035 domain-containing protein [Amaricoccus sp.]|uniref:DUF3035 domain-containing protein n=1 Tax=Amaricoccus sp. TaxID=1872485 RepID=UPI0026340866|nr:DUF3035 domain-containing protein [Amaricoccus sp.]HRO12674.1 DUF3035 domain-containing protein [Amaricoccus sp.]